MVGKLVKQDVREQYPSTTGPLLSNMIDGLRILWLGIRYRNFTTLSPALNGVSDEHSCSDCIFSGLYCSLDMRG